MHQSFLDVGAEGWELSCHSHAHLHPSLKLPGSLRGESPSHAAGLGGMGPAEGLMAVGVNWQEGRVSAGQSGGLWLTWANR